MASAPKWALVGSESLMGRELRALIDESGLPVSLKLIAADPEKVGSLTEQGGEPAVILPFDEQAVRGSRIVFLAGTQESSHEILEQAGGSRVLIDLTHAAEDHPRSFIRAPFVEPAEFRAPEDAVQLIAHPAAIAIAMVLPRLHARYPIKRSVIHIFEPASERGMQGLEELQQQTVSLLSFKSMPKKIFDQQLSYNMLPRYGEEAPVSVETIELRVERHLATLLSRGAYSGASVPMPSLRLIQAPVFHGYSLSLWIEFVDNPGVEAMEAALAGDHIDVRNSGLEPPTSVGMAGQGGIAVGAITMDRNAGQACWCWLAADNVRLAGENAVAVGSQFL